MDSDENHVSPDDFLKVPGENPLSLAEYHVVLVENHVSPAQNHVVPGDGHVVIGGRTALKFREVGAETQNIGSPNECRRRAPDRLLLWLHETKATHPLPSC